MGVTQIQEWLAEAGAVAAREDRQAALSLLNAQPKIPAVTDDPGQLRIWADLAFTAGEWTQATQLYELLAERLPSFYWPQFQIGRSRQRLGNCAAAVEAFRHATELAADFAWSWYELLRCAVDLKDSKLAAFGASGFVRATPVKLGHVHLQAVASAAHFLFEAKLRQEPYELYRLLIECGTADDLVHLRHAEYFIWKRDFPAALRLLEELEGKGRLKDWGRRALAQTYAELERPNEAAGILRELVKRSPKNFQFVSDLVDVLIDLGQPEEARSVVERAGASLARAHSEHLRIRLLAGLSDYQSLVDLFACEPMFGPDTIQHLLDRAIVTCINKARNYSTAAYLIEYRLVRFGYSDAVASASLNAAFATRDWSAARSWLTRIPRDSFDKSTELRVKRFEFHCFVGELAEAERCLTALEPVAELPAQFQHCILKFHAERGNWQQAYKMGIQLASSSACSAETSYLILRAIRKTRNHADAIVQLEAAANLPGAQRLRSTLQEERACLEKDFGALCDQNLEYSAAITSRLVFKRCVFGAGEPSRTKRFAVYYCTNPTYLGPSLVSLVSLTHSNWDLLRDAAVYLVVDDPCAHELACRAAAKLERKLEVSPVTVVSREEILSAGTALKTSYGLFTGGQALAEAAYYRIFFARYLRLQGHHERALYIDSDTIVHGDINPLLQERTEYPLRARLEISRPEVEAAIEQHRLSPGQYFNSGVLAFDLQHPELDCALEETIRAVHERQAELIFQDQCALNIGFQGRFSKLDPSYNHFITPHDPDPKSEGAILHFLDRPKPWDPMYSGKLCRLWFLHWSRLARLIGNDHAITLYNMANAG